MWVSNEAVRPVLLYFYARGVVTRNLIDLGVLSVTRKEFVAESEKICPWKAVVLEDNSFIDMFEEPIDTADHPVAKTPVVLLKL